MNGGVGKDRLRPRSPAVLHEVEPRPGCCRGHGPSKKLTPGAQPRTWVINGALRVVDLFAVFHGDTIDFLRGGHAETTNGLKPRL